METSKYTKSVFVIICIIITFGACDLLDEGDDPVAYLGDDITVNLGDTVEIQANATDAKGVVEYIWGIVEKPDESQITVPGGSNRILKITPDAPGIYVLELVVVAENGTSKPARIKVEVIGEAIPEKQLAVVDSIAITSAFGGSVHGIVWVDGGLWCVSPDMNNLINISPEGVETEVVQVPGNALTGLSFDGSGFLLGDAGNLLIYKVQIDGAVIDSFAVPGGDVTGITWDGNDIWCADFSDLGRIHRLGPRGNFIESFRTPGSAPEGLTWDGDYLCNVDLETGEFYRLGTDGTVFETYKCPGIEPIGLTWDGSYYWLADQLLGIIYKMQIVEQ
jgi:hypothetical protein